MRAGYLWDKGQEYLAKRSSRYIGELVLPRPKYPCTRVQYFQSVTERHSRPPSSPGTYHTKKPQPVPDREKETRK